MKRALLAGVFTTLMLVGNAIADTLTCPPIQNITQTPVAGGGFSYKAPHTGGRFWRGENPQAPASYLTDSTFHDARYFASTEAVTCRYEGQMGNLATVSVTLTPVPNFNRTPVGDWKGWRCSGQEVSDCSFTQRPLAVQNN